MTQRILVAGGGTAGHVFPSIAVALELTRMGDLEPVFVGVGDRLEGRLVPQAGFRLHEIPAVPVPRRPSPALLRLPSGIRRAVAACEQVIEREGVQAAVTFGGYVSFPASRAAVKRGLPLVVHEQNAVPGLANRIASRWADRIAVSFPGSADRFRHRERCAVTGNPVREEMLSVDLAARRAAAQEAFGLGPEMPTVLVFGGSQGARRLNQAVVGAHRELAEQGVQVLHAAGRALYSEAAVAWEQARGSSGAPRVRLVDFIDDMADAYAVADLVVCRSGATSIAELSALGLPSVLVPYPHATADHQKLNAQALELTGGAVAVPDEDLDGERFAETVLPLLVDEDRRRAMADAAKAFGRPDAARNVARLVVERLGQGAAR